MIVLDASALVDVVLDQRTKPWVLDHEAILELAALEQELVPATSDHLTRALELQDRVRVLDGLYVALAEERGVPLVTTDQRLAGSDPPVVVEAP